METLQITTATSVLLSNGFQRGQWVIFVDQTTEGGWTKVGYEGTGECTWAGDEKVSGMEVSLKGKGIIGGYRGVSSHSYQKYVTEFFGFTAEELAGPAPQQGHTCKDHGMSAHAWESVETLAEYLSAKFVWNQFIPWSTMKDGVHEMSYQWGDQAAASYALIKGGKLIDSIMGCGDGTPYLTESEEKCLADGQLHTSDRRSDDAAERSEEEEKFRATAERMGVWEKYMDLALSNDYSGDHYDNQKEQLKKLAYQIESKMKLLEADKRAQSDKTGILRRLLNHYRKGQNPLRSLRREKGGVWTFHRGNPLTTDTLNFQGDGWWVSWKK